MTEVSIQKSDFSLSETGEIQITNPKLIAKIQAAVPADAASVECNDCTTNSGGCQTQNQGCGQTDPIDMLLQFRDQSLILVPPAGVDIRSAASAISNIIVREA